MRILPQRVQDGGHLNSNVYDRKKDLVSWQTY